MDGDEYRVTVPPAGATGRLLERPSLDPVTLADEDHEAAVEGLRPGYVIEADLDWTSPAPTLDALSVRRPTLFAFADGVEPMFEVARETWETARAAGDGMNARETRNTDGETNGAVYVFADEDGELLEEFRDGRRPLDPLLDRVNEREGAAPREVFVLRPADGAFTAVTITLRKGGQFADTIRDTYDLPRPDEPLVE